MLLTELSTVPTAALPVAEFKDHLRLGTGFSDDGVQDAVLDGCLRAAIAAAEAKTGKALISRSFLWSLTAWRDLARQVLPMAPVSEITQLSILDRQNVETVIDVAKYHLEKDTHRPSLVASTLVLPTIPVNGSAEIYFTAGYGTAWADVPADLARGVFLLAAHYYEHRHETATDMSQMPFGIASLLERFRDVRLFGGGRL